MLPNIYIYSDDNTCIAAKNNYRTLQYVRNLLLITSNGDVALCRTHSLIRSITITLSPSHPRSHSLTHSQQLSRPISLFLSAYNIIMMSWRNSCADMKGRKKNNGIYNNILRGFIIIYYGKNNVAAASPHKL